MKFLYRFKALKLISIAIALSLAACSSSIKAPERTAHNIVNQMTLREKIGQKLMIAFSYWCPDDQPDCTKGMTQYNEVVGKAIAQNKIGGVILYAENLVNVDQTAELIWKLQQAAAQDAKAGLFIAIDQEGGHFSNLPGTIATNFPGNMALGAAYEATRDAQLAYQQGQVLAAEVRSVGFNVDFAPVVDVNSNPLNPIINVRAYGDDPHTVGLLGGQAAQGMSSQQVLSTFKHFPGHGDTAIDSHVGLPVVYRSREEADKVDLAPYKTAIQNGMAPDMIMTAHIQYPALDDSTLNSSKTHQTMVVPATLSRKIQHELLRKELGYQGVTVTDGLDMKGISDFFEPSEAVLQAFQAGVDIALTPVEFTVAANAHELSDLVDAIIAAVKEGKLKEEALNRSVERIIALKLRRNIIRDDKKSLDEIKRVAHETIGKSAYQRIEHDIIQKSITVIKNDHGTLPLQSKNERIHIITPYGEQAEAMRQRFEALGYAASGKKISGPTWEAQKQAIDQAHVIIIGTLSEENAQSDDTAPYLTQSNMSNSQFIRHAMEYAKRRGKKVIHIALRAPYDVVNYDDVADAVVVTYSDYDDEKGLRDLSLPVTVDMIVGKIGAQGKLPVNIWTLNPDGSLGQLKYPHGFGLTLNKKKMGL